MLTEQLLKIAAVGGEWILWLLIGLSFLSIGAMVDRWWFFRRRTLDAEAFGGELIKRLQSDDRAGAVQLLSQHRSVEASIVARSMAWFDDGPDAMSEAFEGAVRDARSQLDKGTVLLGTIGNNAPFVGLLGTVLGVVQAFRELGKDTIGAMGSVMTGIGEALVATAVGIVVAIPAVVAFNVFSARAGEVEERARSLMNLIMAHLKSSKRGTAA